MSWQSGVGNFAGILAYSVGFINFAALFPSLVSENHVAVFTIGFICLFLSTLPTLLVREKPEEHSSSYSSTSSSSSSSPLNFYGGLREKGEMEAESGDEKEGRFLEGQEGKREEIEEGVNHHFLRQMVRSLLGITEPVLLVMLVFFAANCMIYPRLLFFTDYM
jgi:hypothetical protein